MKGVLLEMKTIKEVADAVKVSRTSIYNLIKKHNIQTFKRDGKTYIDEAAESLIIGHYSMEQHETAEDIVEEATGDENETLQSDFQDNCKLVQSSHLIELLEKELDSKNKIIQLLEKELEEKNKTIQGLIQALTAEKLNEAKRLMVYDIEFSATKDPQPPKGFFQRIFGRK